jgi:hypothetical protein
VVEVRQRAGNAVVTPRGFSRVDWTMSSSIPESMLQMLPTRLPISATVQWYGGTARCGAKVGHRDLPAKTPLLSNTF